jgi:hypothetical protein
MVPLERSRDLLLLIANGQQYHRVPGILQT